MRLKNKVSLITGAAGGIGRAMARTFASEGAKVVLVDVNEDAGRMVQEEIHREGGSALFLKGDVSVSVDVKHVVEAALKAYSRLDILVNNAFWTKVQPITEMKEDDWDRTLDTCLKSVYLIAKHAIPHMIKSGGGSIINISSINAFITNPGCGAYSAAKAGMLGLTRNLALDYGLQGIRANAICPGIVILDGPASRPGTQAYLDAHPLEKWAVTETQPIGRYARPDDIVGAAVFLASDDSNYMTGANIVIDGGLTIQSPEALLRPSIRQGWREGLLVSEPDK